MSQPLYVFNSAKQDRMTHILNSLGIKVLQTEVDEGSYFDTYSIKLQSGVKHAKIDKVLSDIGMELQAHSFPKGYPVMKEGVYKIEVQTRDLESHTFSDLLQQIPQEMYAPVILGSDTSGGSLFIDLSTLPNLLIGGIPGSGKSVLLHAIIMGLLHTRAQLYLVDPKMVEFNIYENHPYVQSINYTVEETFSLIEQIQEIMDHRFHLLNKTRCRDVHEYNNRFPKKMWPVIMVIDEWADIVLQDNKIQKPLCSIAQKGRAAGISIVLATQRPAATVISGLIRANFSGRIGLKTVTAIDSRIVLDRSGAEKITDIGVGLFLDQRMLEPVMFRTPWIPDPAVELGHIRPPAPPQKRSLWEKLGFSW